MYFEITTAAREKLGWGKYTPDGGAVLIGNVHVGPHPPQAFPNATSALKAFRAIAPTAERIVETAPPPARRIWTGGHHPKGNLRQARHIPTPDEQLAIVDCVD